MTRGCRASAAAECRSCPRAGGDGRNDRRERSDWSRRADWPAGGRDLVLGGQRQALEVVPGPDRMEAGLVEAVALTDDGDAFAQPVQLAGAKPFDHQAARSRSRISASLAGLGFAPAVGLAAASLATTGSKPAGTPASRSRAGSGRVATSAATPSAEMPEGRKAELKRITCGSRTAFRVPWAAPLRPPSTWQRPWCSAMRALAMLKPAR